MARSKWDEDNPINLLERIKVLESIVTIEYQEQIKQLAGALLELTKEVGTNREMMAKNSHLLRRITEALKQLTEV
mgnify:CR=1 FL=1|tara:strand:+ start:563 stop:787 length:225 start_codon:yes stop_codon:yes gene_type:complete